MPPQPDSDFGVFVGWVVGEDHPDFLASRHAAVDRVKGADELLMAVSLHVPADHDPIEHIQRSERRGHAIPLVVVCRGARPAFFIGMPDGVRSGSRIWHSSSTESTAACAGNSI